MKLFKTAWAPVALALFALPLATACSSDDEEEPSNKRRTISVVVTENPMQNESAGARSTRADITTTESFSTFKMEAQDIQTYTATKSGTPSRWGVSPDIWPYGVGVNEKINFYAYNGGNAATFNYNSVDPYISFEMGNQSANLVDLMVAQCNTSENDHGGQVPLTFNHACAAVKFNVYCVDGQTYSVKSITLKNVVKKGEYHFNNESNKWVLDYENIGNYLLTTEAFTPNSTDRQLPCDWMFIIPQLKKDDANKTDINIEVRYTKSGSDEVKTKTLSLPSGLWAARTKYSVRIRIGNAPQS